MEVFVLLFTFYDDDYKNTEDIIDIHIFDTLEKCEQHINIMIMDNIGDYIHFQTPETEKYIVFDPKTDNYLIKTEYHNNRQVLTLLYNTYCVGEFVNYKFDWKVEKHNIL